MRGIVSGLFLLLTVLACGQRDPAGHVNTQEETESQIQGLDALMACRQRMRDQLVKGGEARELILEFIESTEQYVRAFPFDTLGPAFLLEAAQLAGGIGRPGNSIELWGLLWRNHPDHPEAPYAMFMQAFVFETTIGDTVNARWYFEKVISTYPEHPLAASARQSLSAMGKSAKDLIQQIDTSKKY